MIRRFADIQSSCHTCIHHIIYRESTRQKTGIKHYCLGKVLCIIATRRRHYCHGETQLKHIRLGKALLPREGIVAMGRRHIATGRHESSMFALGRKALLQRGGNIATRRHYCHGETRIKHYCLGGHYCYGEAFCHREALLPREGILATGRHYSHGEALLRRGGNIQHFHGVSVTLTEPVILPPYNTRHALRCYQNRY